MHVISPVLYITKLLTTKTLQPFLKKVCSTRGRQISAYEKLLRDLSMYWYSQNYFLLLARVGLILRTCSRNLVYLKTVEQLAVLPAVHCLKYDTNLKWSTSTLVSFLFFDPPFQVVGFTPTCLAFWVVCPGLCWWPELVSFIQTLWLPHLCTNSSLSSPNGMALKKI